MPVTLVRFRIATLALAFTLGAQGAAAQGGPQERAAAESLFRDAKDLVAKGKVVEACPKFAESHRLDPKLGTLMHLATCYEQAGRTASAWIEWTEAAQLAARTKQPDREKAARERVAALEPKLSRVTLNAAASIAGLKLVLDGRPIGEGMLGSPIPTDPGEHLLEASAPQRKSLSVKVIVPEGPGTTTVLIPALESEAPPPAPAPVTAPVAPAPAPTGDDGSTVKILGWGLVGVGAIGLGLGTFFGVRAASLKGDADRECPNKACSPSGLEAYDDGMAAAGLSTVAFTVGAVAAGAGVTLLLVGNKPVTAAVAPTGARSGAFTLRGSF